MLAFYRSFISDDLPAAHVRIALGRYVERWNRLISVDDAADHQWVWKTIVKSFEERRPARRVAVVLDATYSSAGMPAARARVAEISTTGMRLLTLEPLPIGMMLDLDVAFNIDPRNKRLKMVGQVVREIAIGPPFAYGVRIIGDHVVKGALRTAVLQLSLKPAAPTPSGATK